MEVFQIESKKLPIDYENDRIILVLLSHINEKSSSQQKRYMNLLNRYEDNEVYQKDIIEKLVTAGYMNTVDLEPDKPKQCQKTGAIIKHEVRYETSKSGIKALKNGRFVSEYNSIMWKRVGSGLQWGLTLVSIVGGILGIYAKCESTSAITPPTINETINTTDSTIIKPSTKAISVIQCDSSPIQSGRLKYIHSDKNKQSNLKAIDAAKIHPIIE